MLHGAHPIEGGCMAPMLVLAEHHIDAIVVNGIGGGLLMGFVQAGIAAHAGAGTDAQTAVRAYIDGRLPVVGLEGACQH